MNKLKVLYDVVTTMKNKEFFNGILTVQVNKDEAALFSLQNEFEKNLLTGETKAKISTEYTNPHSDECKCREFFKKMHQCHAAGCCGLRGKLTKLAVAFSILNALQASEQDSKTIVLSLKSSDLPEDMKASLYEKIRQAHGCCCAVEQCDFAVNIFVNKNSAVDKIMFNLNGLQKDELNESHKLTARAELSFTW